MGGEHRWAACMREAWGCGHLVGPQPLFPDHRATPFRRRPIWFQDASWSVSLTSPAPSGQAHEASALAP